MSYSLWVEMDAGGSEPMTAGSWNYTSNCALMWREAGADLAEFDGRKAKDCLTFVIDAVAELKANPKKYRAMDPPNGWGSYDSLLPAIVELGELFVQYPEATVRVH